MITEALSYLSNELLVHLYTEALAYLIDSMVDLNIFKQLQQAPIEERIQLIELLLQSVKEDLKRNSTSSKFFQVCSFSLGGDISINRDELYSERTLLG